MFDGVAHRHVRTEHGARRLHHPADGAFAVLLVGTPLRRQLRRRDMHDAVHQTAGEFGQHIGGERALASFAILCRSSSDIAGFAFGIVGTVTSRHQAARLRRHEYSDGAATLRVFVRMRRLRCVVRRRMPLLPEP